MLNPHYRSATVQRRDCDVMIDSGAFQERDMLRRLTPAEALERQLNYASAQVAKAGPQRITVVTYDMLLGVDEALVDGRRVKRRGNEETAAPAVAETIRSAVYYAGQRARLDSIGVRIAFAAQGATVRQYLRCVDEILPIMRKGDMLAFGGFCIIGMVPSLKPLFAETVAAVLPRLRRAGIERAHILGVCVHDALIAAAAEGRKHGVLLSTDSSSIEINSVHGRLWDQRHMATGRRGSPWRQAYSKEQKRAPGGYHPCTLALENIARFTAWASTLTTYQHAPTRPRQMELWP